MKSRGGKNAFRILMDEITKREVSCKSHERNLANFKLLVAYIPFQEEVRIVREGLKIKPGGYPTQIERLAWHDRAMQESERIANTKEFNKKLWHVSQQKNNREISPRIAQQIVKKNNEDLPVNVLKGIANRLVKDFHLPLHYSSAVVGYILSGVVSAPYHNYEPVSKPIAEIRKPILTIDIYTRLTQDELNELVGFIDLNSGRYPLPRYQALPSDVDLRIEIKEAYDSYQQDRRDGKKKVTLADLAEEYLEDRSKANQILAIVRDLRKIQQIRFSSVRKRRL